MDENQKRKVEAFFKGKETFKRVYLSPPTSQKNVPTGMENLDKMLEDMKISNETRSMERLDKWLASRKQAGRH